MRGFQLTCLALLAALCSLARADEATELRAAINRALPLIERSAATYLRERDCFSCHHQSLPAFVWTDVRAKGFDCDEAGARQQAKFTLDYFAARKKDMLQGKDVLGEAYSAGYALAGLAAENVAPDETTAALVTYLLKTQEANGRWWIGGGIHRPPLEDSHFTATALALQALSEWKVEGKADDSQVAIRRGREWLESTQPTTTEDAAFRLLGLLTAASDEDHLLKAVTFLIDLQQHDDGWSQDKGLSSDAYATGLALVALQIAAKQPALGINQDRLRRGRRWLLSQQHADGSWLVVTRAKPFQEYFESGYPHDESQFISLAAACRAVQALAGGL